MAGAQTVSFLDPQTDLAMQLQQSQAQRQMDLADALRQKSLTALPTNQGPLSPWQGIAQLAQAIAANHIQRRAMAGQYDAMANATNAQGRSFGAPGNVIDPAQNPYASNGQGRNFGQRIGDFIAGGAPISPPRPAAAATLQPSPSGAMPQPVTAAPPMPQSSQLPASSQVGAVAAPAAVPLSAAGQIPAPQGAPVQQPMQQQQTGQSPAALTGDWRTNMLLGRANPEEYTKALIGQATPTDTAKLYTQAQQAAASGNTGLAATLYAQLTKNTNIPDENFRGGSWSKNPTTGVLQYHPTLPEGSAPQIGPNGQVQSVSAIPGASGVEAAMAGAKAGGSASGAAPYELVEQSDAQGNKSFVRKSTLVGGGNGGGAAQGGTLNGFYGGGNAGAAPAPGPAMSNVGPGTTASLTAAGKNSANAHQAALDAGNNAKSAMFTIDQMLTAANGLQTGTGAGAVSSLKSGANAALGSSLGVHPFDTRDIAKFDVIKKDAANLGDQLSQAVGGGTDARLKNALDSLPNANYSPAAFQEVGINLKAKAAAAYGRSQADAKWQLTHGPQDYPQFQSAWQNAYNPDIFYAIQRDGGVIKPGGVLAGYINSKNTSPTARAKLQQQIYQLRQLGGL